MTTAAKGYARDNWSKAAKLWAINACKIKITNQYVKRLKLVYWVLQAAYI